MSFEAAKSTQVFTNGSATYDAYCGCSPHPTLGYTSLLKLRYLMDQHLSIYQTWSRSSIPAVL